MHNLTVTGLLFPNLFRNYYCDFHKLTALCVYLFLNLNNNKLKRVDVVADEVEVNACVCWVSYYTWILNRSRTQSHATLKWLGCWLHNLNIRFEIVGAARDWNCGGDSSTGQIFLFKHYYLLYCKVHGCGRAETGTEAWTVIKGWYDKYSYKHTHAHTQIETNKDKMGIACRFVSCPVV